jgi:hypothetical protein
MMADPQGDPREEYERRQSRPTAEVIPPGMDDMAEAARSLGELAVNGDMTLVQERSLFGDLITAQPVRVARNDAKILQRIDVWGGIAGERWFYRYPVRNRRTGRVDYIEGPSVKCTNAVARLFGNCSVESRTVALDAKRDICYSRFGDLETGFSITKGQIVPRSATLGGDDEERRQQIAHNIGQSKSQRNVVEAALGDFAQRGFLAAKNSIVEKIGKNIEKARIRIVELLNELAQEKGVVGIVPRVEYVKGRKVDEWLAPDIAGVHGEIEFIADGMASIDETWPLPPPPEPRRGDTESGPAATPAATTPPAAAADAGAAAASSPTPQPGGSVPPSSGSVNENAEVPKPADGDVAGERTEGSGIASPTPPPPRNWQVPPDTMGQDAIIRVLGELLDETQTDADQDQLEQQNAERIAKITGEKGRLLRKRFDDKRKARHA